jgi:hypothetical protein
MKIAISAGHYPDRPGAVYNGHHEHLEAVLIAGWVIYILQQLGARAWLIGAGRLREKVEAINAGGFDCAVEVHLNTGGGSGCETLFCPGSGKGNDLAGSIQRHIVTRTLLPSRGIKEGWYRMDRPGVVDYPGDEDGDETVDFFLRKTSCPAVIAEPFFLDGDFVKCVGNFKMITGSAEGIALGVMDWIL